MIKFLTIALLAAGLTFAQQPGRRGPQRGRIAQELNLTDAQKEQLKPIMKEQADKMRALRDQNQSQREELKKLRDENDAKVRAILTPEQAAKFDEIKKQGRGGRRGGRGPRA
jgi:protein CpxP